MSKAIEVITSAERRRRWSAAEKERLVAACQCRFKVKFPRRRVAVISRLDDLGLHFWVADRGGAAAVPGLAS